MQKLIRHTHEWIMHLGTASTMATIRQLWCILKLRYMVKRMICNCNNCKVFAAKPFKGGATVPLPRFKTAVSRSIQLGLILLDHLFTKGTRTKKERLILSYSLAQFYGQYTFEWKRPNSWRIPEETQCIYHLEGRATMDGIWQCSCPYLRKLWIGSRECGEMSSYRISLPFKKYSGSST